MAATVHGVQSSSNASLHEEKQTAPSTSGVQNYKGFVAGVGSGIAKLSVGHPYVLFAAP